MKSNPVRGKHDSQTPKRRCGQLTTIFSAANDTNNNYFDSNNGAITGAVKGDDENRIPDVPIHLQGLEGTSTIVVGTVNSNRA